MWWSRHLMRCDGLCCVMSRDAMRCHGDELYYSVLQSTTPVLTCTTKYYTTLYYKVLLQYYPVLQSTTPVLLQYYSVLQILLCTTKYYSSTTLYYKVPLLYHSVLQSTTPILLRTTNTTLYYKVLLQYCLVLQSTTPVLLCTTKYYSSTTLYYSSTTKYYSRYYKTALMIDPHRIWNVIYNAQSNRHHRPTSPNTAPATQNESHDWSASHMKRHLQCVEQQSTPSKYCAGHAQWISWLIRITYETSFTMRRATVNRLEPHQILRLPRKMTARHLTEISRKQLKRHFQCATDPSMIRPWSENDPTINSQTATRRATEPTCRTR